MKPIRSIRYLLFTFLILQTASAQNWNRQPFNHDWHFILESITEPPGTAGFLQHNWRTLDLPHDWSIELPFDKDSPTGTGGGALRGGLGWYYKTFTLPEPDRGRKIYIDFDGVYMNSEVFINGTSCGVRPNGFISFRYDLTPYLKYGKETNLIAVKVDNSHQPNSRWYSGSGIYRDVWLEKDAPLHIPQWGIHVTTPSVSAQRAQLTIETEFTNEMQKEGDIVIQQQLFSREKKMEATVAYKGKAGAGLQSEIMQGISVANPHLWSTADPYLYSLETTLLLNGKIVQSVTTAVGFRFFQFDTDKGFFLNGEPLKIRGVCNHHDLGCLGTAFNKSAARRQLQLLKDMGVNALRTSHNPPGPGLLDLCDEMGILVMDEAFDMWKQAKNPYDYHLYWDQWHLKDLTDQVLRDRNHPSVLIWSVGNEIPEQGMNSLDTATAMLRELYTTVKNLDPTRPVVTANNEPGAWNRFLKANICDLIGYNYADGKWNTVFQDWYRKPFIVTESVSALQTRGHYDMPSDSIRIWPSRWDKPLTDANPDTTCSAYDNCRTPWGSTHETSLKLLEKYPHVSGMFIWTGFDYIGEPTPYPWPARSSYFGILDMAGFPKDAFYLYQSVWTNKPVLHVFPHWNWKPGQTIDLWAYYNNADEAELYINGKSQGIRKKDGDAMHVMWRVQFEPGTAKVITRKNGKTVLEKQISTTGAPAQIRLVADRAAIKAGGDDLSFVRAEICDKEGRVVPDADQTIQFSISGSGSIAGTDNGLQTDLRLFGSTARKSLAGLCLAVIRSGKTKGTCTLKAMAPGLKTASIQLTIQ